jgi:hypothetical protein
MPKRNPTKSQRAVMELLDQGLPVEQIANSLGKSALAVKKQLNRIKRRVREGRIDPSPLPIERAASEPRVYLAGFDVSIGPTSAMSLPGSGRCARSRASWSRHRRWQKSWRQSCNWNGRRSRSPDG